MSYGIILHGIRRYESQKHQLSCGVVHGLSPLIGSLLRDRLATFHEQADVWTGRF
jgi:putative Mn2+ efflux pump MntP